MDEIKAYDTVQLKSGGPVMTVSCLGNHSGKKDGATCIWFDKNEEVKTKVFDRGVLKKVDPEDDDPLEPGMG